MSEGRILSALIHDRTVYDSIEAVMSVEDDFSDQGQVIAGFVKEYYDNDEDASCVDKSFLIDQIKASLPKHGATFEGIINTLEEVSIPNALSEFRKLKQASIAQRLAEALLQKDDKLIASLIEKHQHYSDMRAMDDEGDVFINTDLDTVLTAFNNENLIKVFPKSLNDALGGGLVRGTQVAVYAPTEVGKSLITINMAAGFLMQGLKVLYCGNEDPAMMMLKRFYTRLTGMNQEQMDADRPKAYQIAQDKGYGNLVFYEMKPGNLFDIKRAVERYEPDILVVDQMANMETVGNFTKVEKNEHLALKIRSIAKKYDMVSIIVHQASDSGYGKLHLEKNDMYYSNVGVQGQMDVMIGIGMDDMYEQQDKRMLCLTKNKINSNHANIPVKIDPHLTKVSNLGDTE